MSAAAQRLNLRTMRYRSILTACLLAAAAAVGTAVGTAADTAADTGGLCRGYASSSDEASAASAVLASDRGRISPR